MASNVLVQDDCHTGDNEAPVPVTQPSQLSDQDTDQQQAQPSTYEEGIAIIEEVPFDSYETSEQ